MKNKEQMLKLVRFGFWPVKPANAKESDSGCSFWKRGSVTVTNFNPKTNDGINLIIKNARGVSNIVEIDTINNALLFEQEIEKVY